MKRRPLICGNWKLNNTLGESQTLATQIKSKIASAVVRDVEVAVAPVFTALTVVKQALEGSSIKLCAQHVHFEEQGAFTGEVSAPLLKDAGASLCIVGHSERRALFGDDDAKIHRRICALLEHDLCPILCVGESLAEREAGKATEVVLDQLGRALDGIEPSRLKPLIVAYEPIWAIGTGRTASPADAQEVHRTVRIFLIEHLGRLGDELRILYGGSVKPNNAEMLLAQPDIDGALVGGASLKADSFIAIASAAP